MKKLKCKLIVSDFDGTLADSNNAVPPEVVSAINSYVSDGGIFCVCTGRMLSSVLPRVRALNLKGFVAAYQGGTIADIESGKVIRDALFSRKQSFLACKAAEEVSETFQVYKGGNMYTTMAKDDKNLKLYEDVIGVRAKHPRCPLSEFVKKNNMRINKVAALCYPEDKLRIYETLKEKLGDGYDVSYSAAVLVEVSPLGATKGEAFKFLADYYGIPKELTVAVGDNLNDASMIEEAGWGIAVGNAVPELKKVARCVTVTNDEGAIARVIADYGYERS